MLAEITSPQSLNKENISLKCHGLEAIRLTFGNDEASHSLDQDQDQVLSLIVDSRKEGEVLEVEEIHPNKKGNENLANFIQDKGGALENTDSKSIPSLALERDSGRVEVPIEDEGEIRRKRGRPSKSAKKVKSIKKVVSSNQRKATDNDTELNENDEAFLTWQLGKLIGLRTDNEEGVLDALRRSKRRSQKSESY